MRVVATSDTHNNYPKMPAGDVFIHCGDLTARGTPAELGKAFEWILSIPCAHKIVIAGNHDFGLENKSYVPPAGVMYLNSSGVEILGLKIWGSPVVQRFQNWAFMRSEHEMHETWREIPEDLTVLVTHSPPAGVMDRAGTNHAGCTALLDAVVEKRPSLHLFGHVHEGYGRVTGRGTTFANVSFVGVDEYGRAKSANYPQVFDMLVLK